jgi:hypothetical protein
MIQPYVHVALRGRALDFGREYVKQGIRAIAEDYCTRQLGTTLDAAEAERREVSQRRFTSIKSGLGEAERLHEQHGAARLAFLEAMGLPSLFNQTSGAFGATLKAFCALCS